MRLAYITYEFPPDSAYGGIATYVEQAAELMVSRGWDVEVFSSSPQRQETEERNGYQVHWLPSNERSTFTNIAGPVFARRHAASPFDLVEGPEYKSDARVAAGLCPKVPLVVKMHTPSALIDRMNTHRHVSWLQAGTRAVRQACTSTLRDGKPRLSGVLAGTSAAVWRQDRREATHARKASLVTAPCTDLCKYAEQTWRIPRSKIRHVPYPYSPNPALLALPRPTAGCVIGYVGRLEKRKGIEPLAKAIPRVCEQTPNVRFRFVGAAQHPSPSGVPYDDWLMRQCGKWASNIEFTGKVPLHSMPEVYAAIDICVYPSLWENFPNVCLEAMAAGRAIVASKHGGMREMLGDGIAGLLIDPHAPDDLTQAILLLAGDQERRRELGDNARSRLISSYNTKTIGELMERTYLEAIQIGR